MASDESTAVTKRENAALQTKALNLAWAHEALRLDFKVAARNRRIAFLRRMALFVGLPTLIAVIYVFAYATPRYVSEFQLTYQTFSQPGSVLPGMALGGQSSLLTSVLGVGANSVDMSRVIASYLVSADLVRYVDRKVNLREKFGSTKIDWLDRLPADATQEQLVEYFRKRITVDALMGGYVIVDVEAFDRETAMQIGEAMTAAADDMVQSLSNRALLDQVRLAEKELARTQDRLVAATLKVTDFRNAHHNFDPQAAAAQLGSVVGGLETQLSSYRATLATLRNFVSEDAPVVRALRAQIQATEQEMTSESHRLAAASSPSGSVQTQRSEPYSQMVSDYVYLTEEQQFATDAYTSAKVALDSARTNAANKRAYVESFVKPLAPDQSTSPGPLRTIFGTAIVALLLYMTGNLLLGAFKDQAGV